ncbi:MULTISPECIES: flagellar biosynthetic protein FliR [unclassified Rhizobium]|uniref:flagellar biosynthetic protein FliR n=1 Tax=unclassified Rhizobium TaxID=2613769 RepID=UPI000629FC12|nr:MULTISPECIES: flagellar biosynthetic protein FliR [unclassified Rhizobium]KKX31990.1 flagellar biosynthesis protein FliR [Rhizobium sp. LC145]OHV75764.1 flagellar biosynthetic protein FliR [Rhizobium sp. LCM 4573]TKT58962.1 flagellar type III secretion system protein FliR [Rhizobiaceae bacterium LC148]
MITDPQGTILALFLAFCRMGACVMVLPGFGSARISTNIRLFLAVAISMAVLPVLWDTIYPRASEPTATYLGLIASETLIGAVYGLIARLYALGLQFAGTIVAMSIGFTAPGGHDVLEDTSENQLTTLLTFSGLLLLFMLDFHHVVFRALVESYAATPVGAIADPQRMLITLTDTLRASTYLMLQLASPFLIYGLMFNVAIGLINKLAPQIPVFFISTPFLLVGGIFLLYLSIAVMIRQFAGGFAPIFLSF